MTRINLVPVTELADQHLMAEYRELPMVPASLRRTLNSKMGFQIKRVSIPYTLNAGHVYFFFNKGQFLLNRWHLLIDELRRRNFNIDPESRDVKWDMFDQVEQRVWVPTEADITLSRERIRTRLAQRPGWYRWTKVDI